MLKPAFIDISHHNEIPASLKPARDSGIVGVIHKATEGFSNVDDKLDARHWLVQDAGMLWGMYHFVRPGDMGAQLDHFLDTAGPYMDENTLLALDWEDTGVSANDAVDFMQGLAYKTHRSPVLYSGHVVKELGADREDLMCYRLWLAQYSDAPELPSGWDRWWGWQYTDQGECPGPTPPTDLNAYNGTRRGLLLDWSGREPEPQPPEEEDLDITVIVPPGMAVRVLTRRR